MRSLPLFHMLRLPLLPARRPPLTSSRRRIVIRIVPVRIDRLAHIVLPLVDLLPLLARQRAAIRRAIRLRLPVDARVPLLEVPRLPRRQLPAVHALVDPRLLIPLPPVHLIRMAKSIPARL